MSTQSNWWWCNKCQVLTFGGNLTSGVCQAGGLHDHSGSGQYSVVHDEPAAPGQSDWRWCNKCTALSFAGNASAGSCAAGGVHDHAGSGDYSLVQNDATAPGQSNWRWCKNCEVLAFAGNGSLGPCPAGGMHDHTGSGNYSVFIAEGTREPIDQTISRHVLTEFGPCDTVKAATATLEAACTMLAAKGGGVIVVPDSVPSDFRPRNAIQDARSSTNAGVLIEDFRNGGMRLVVRPEGVVDVTGSIGGGVLVERDIVNSIHGQGGGAALGVSSRSRGGVNSVGDYVQAPVSPQKGPPRDVKCYVVSHRGLCPGNWINIATADNQVFSGPIKALGLDGDKPYFVVETTYGFNKDAYYWNKNWFSALELYDTHNCDDQSGTFTLTRKTYGTGDSFAIQAQLNYSGDIMSGGGDEGAIVYAATIIHDTDLFSGRVETWDPATASLVYSADSVNANKLGTSRPIVNMQTAKWIRSGKIVISNQGMFGNADVQWDESIVGKFITVDEPTEYYDPADPHDQDRAARLAGSLSQIVRRWYRIGSLSKRKDGSWMVGIEGVWFNHNYINGVPTLINQSNHTSSDEHPVELNYIIAAGSWAVDVSDAVSPGSEPSMRTIRLAPFRRAQGAFAPGDPIAQPAGPNPWKPMSFRTRVSNFFPETVPVGLVEIQQFGPMQSHAGIWVRGYEDTTFADGTRYTGKDGRPAYVAAIEVTGTANYGVYLGGPVTEAAIYIGGTVQNETAIVLDQRDPGKAGGTNKKAIYWNNVGTNSYVDCEPATNDLRITTRNFIINASGHVDLQAKSTVEQGGISGSSLAANNLRAVDVAVPAGASSKVVTFATAEPDAHYAVLAECDWLTAKSVHNKTARGFTVQFAAKVPPAGGKVDWLLVR